MTTHRHYSAFPEGCIGVDEAAQAAGVSAGMLRMWEMRHGWPRPNRAPNGYRYFTPASVELLTRVAACVRNGMRIGDLVRDGLPRLPGTPNPQQECGLHAQIALLRECLLMDEWRRTSTEGQALVAHALKHADGGQAILKEVRELRAIIAAGPPAPHSALPSAPSEAPVARAMEARNDEVAKLRADLVAANRRAEDLAKRLDVMQRAHQRAMEVERPILMRRIEQVETENRRLKRLGAKG